MRSRGGKLALYVAKRLLYLVPVLLFVTLITFFLAHLAPGSPWDREGKQLSETTIRNLNIKYGLDQPLWRQLVLYIWNAAHFDFGDSFQYPGQSVKDLILAGWPVTLTLGATAFIIIVPTGIILGTVAALRQNTLIDYFALGLATVGTAVPNLVVGIVLLIVFSVGLYRITGGDYYLPTGGFGFDQHLILPVITLSVLPIAFLARLTRVSTLEVMRQDYVRTAWAKGLAGRVVVVKHVLKNALIPVVTYLGPLFALLVTGSVIVETIFSMPGIGRTFFTAINARDYPMILGTTLLFALIVAVANLVVDVLYTFIDPRVRLD